MRSKLLFILLFLSFSVSAQADIVTLDNVFASRDVYSSDFNVRLNRDLTQLANGINNVETDQIANDTLTEADMADEINPRIRDYELGGYGLECEMVYTGLLPATSASLTSNISAGTGYPRGYRIVKGSGTAKTYTASKWTWVDLDINGDFQYSVVAIGGATPAVASNSIRLAKVSTDGTTINTVTDLRVTSCAQGPFTNISSSTGEPNLNDVFKAGTPGRKNFLGGRSSQGFAQGAFVSWDTETTFKVTAGSLYINGEYRVSTVDITVPQTNDAPTTSTSGLDTGAIGASKKYLVYGMADENAVKPFSISYCDGTSAVCTPSGATNYRLIGSVMTDQGSKFTSRDMSSAYGITEREVPFAAITHNNGALLDSYNISGITLNSTGNYTVTFAVPPQNTNYQALCVGSQGGANQTNSCAKDEATAQTITTWTHECCEGGAATTNARVSCIFFGDTRR